MNPNPNTDLTIIDILRKQLAQGRILCLQLSEETEMNLSRLSFWIGTNNDKNQMTGSKPLVERIQQAEAFISATDAYLYYADHEEDYGDYYIGATDTIYLSYPIDFLKDDASQIANYYRIVFHELAHWTGNPHRLNRCHCNTTGTLDWAKEELTAELTSAFLLSKFGITENSVRDHAGYLEKWIPIIDLLNDNKTSISAVALQANQAYDYLFSLQNKFT